MMNPSLSALKSRQNSFFIEGKTLSYEFRVENLKRLENCIRAYESQILEALKADLGKSELEAYVGEVGSLLEEIRFAVRHLKKWMKPEKVATPMIQWPAKSRLYSEPLGVVLIIAPWNYPVQLSLSPLIGAMAAGNCAVIKPSEISSHSSGVIEEMISKTFPENYIAVVTGGVEVSQFLLSEPWGHIFFTGGTEIGRKVMMEAAKTLTPVTLELGGKSPCLIDSDVDWEVTANRIVWGKFFNSGQTCVAPDYLLLPKGSAPNFVSLLEKTIREFYSDNPHGSLDYGRVINVGHYQRLKKYLSQGKVVIGGECNDNEKYISPTVMVDISWDSEIMT
ncbi:MAG: aldehyde dehydrogenase family protein, partial [Deltaproteobacteria bacterium]